MITEAFEQSGAPVRLHVAGDGEQAMQFLRRAAASPMPRSGLIVLDLNLPIFVLPIACRGHGEG
jgi:CheY-like chemotaxis protein